MNSKIYRQADSRWGNLPYPTKAYSFAGNGCGCCACTHNIIEIGQYANYTPANIRPYMVAQGFATKGHGTTWNGITKTLEHYGFKVETPNISSSMTAAWNLLNKTGAPKQGVLLFRGGTRGGVRWTSGGHYVAFLDYRVTNGKHYFYTKDSGGRHHDGWYCYETTMKGLLPRIWIVTAKPNSPAPAPTPKPTPSKPAKGTYTGLIPTPTIKKGTKADKVKTLQKFLNWYGGYGLAVDGICGKGTVNAIKKFQKAEGITADGIYGKNSHDKAYAYKKKVNPR
jgi:hypothetical protein